MKKDLFRKEALDNLKSPENLNGFLTVTNVPVWIILIAILLIGIGFAIWCFTAVIGGGIHPINLL